MSKNQKQQAILKFVKYNDYGCPIFAINNTDDIKTYELLGKIQRSFNLRYPSEYNPLYSKNGTIWAQFGKKASTKFETGEVYELTFIPIIGKTAKGKTYLNLKIYEVNHIQTEYQVLQFYIFQ